MKTLLMFASGLGLFACNQLSNPISQSQTNTDPLPGQLQLIQGLSKVSSASILDSTSSYVFNLDTANGSFQEDFILQNTGDYDVDSIYLTTNNPHFYFTPSVVPVLHCVKTSLVMQVIKLNVIHGSKLKGAGYDSLLPMGMNFAQAQITATTTDAHNHSIHISQNAQLKVFAHVVNVAVFTNDSIPYDLSNPTNMGNCGISPENSPVFLGTKGQFKVRNTGNVPIQISTWPDPASGSPSSIFQVKVDSSFYFSTRAVLKLDGGGVASNPYTLPMQRDGSVYLCFAGISGQP